MFDTLLVMAVALADEAVEAPDSVDTAAGRERCAELEARLRTLAAQITAVQAEFLETLAEYDGLRGWAAWGARSVRDWLSNHCGHGPTLARNEAALAEALRYLPRTAAAMACGALSMDKAKAIAGVATPETEEELLALAREATANQLIRALAAARRALSGDDGERLRRARRLHTWWDDDGMLAIRGRLTPEEGALFRKALEAARESIHRDQRATGFEGDPPPEGEADVRPDPAADAEDPPGARNADALVAMAEAYLASAPVAAADGDNYLVLIHVDAHALVDDGDGRCHLEGGPALSRDVVSRLACGASLVWLAEDHDGQPVAISDKTQDIPTSVRRAVRARDKGCVFPTGSGGRCGITPERCHVHHVVHRRHHGPHTSRNCRCLCSFHHHLVHEGGFAMRFLDDGTLEFRRPDGTPIATGPPPVPDLIDLSSSLRLDLEPDIAWARSNGEPMDLALTVDGLLSLGLRNSPGP